jgi:hypothetical protein
VDKRAAAFGILQASVSLYYSKLALLDTFLRSDKSGPPGSLWFVAAERVDWTLADATALLQFSSRAPSHWLASLLMRRTWGYASSTSPCI